MLLFCPTRIRTRMQDSHVNIHDDVVNSFPMKGNLLPLRLSFVFVSVSAVIEMDVLYILLRCLGTNLKHHRTVALHPKIPIELSHKMCLRLL